MKKRQGNQQYQDRVNRVLNYIAANLDGDLSLSRLASISCFSPFHFHRVFQAATGETVHAHVRRIRLERAASLLRASPQKRITDVAIETGFAGTAEFSRAFKAHFGHTASSWNRHSPLENSKICKESGGMPFHTVEELERWNAQRGMGSRVTVQPSKAFRYVYSRIFAPYNNNAFLDRYREMLAWLADSGTRLCDVVAIGMSPDDPSITPAATYRYDFGFAFPLARRGSNDLLSEIIGARGGGSLVSPPAETAGFSVREFEPLQLATITCQGDIQEVDYAWHYLYRVWLPASHYEPADLPAMELFVKLPEEIGWEVFDLKLCIPVVRL